MFNPDELLSLPEIKIPPKCDDCGVICDAKKRLASLFYQKYVINHAGESLVGEEGEEFDSMVDENMPPELAEMLKKGIRTSVGEDLADIDDDIDSINAEINANTLACQGVLKMRASKGDATYTVSVCTSPRVYYRDSDKPQHISTHVDVRSNNS